MCCRTDSLRLAKCDEATDRHTILRMTLKSRCCCALTVTINVHLHIYIWLFLVRCLVQRRPRPQAIYMSQGGNKCPKAAHKSQGRPTRAQGRHQRPKEAHKGPGGPTKTQGGPQQPSEAHKSPRGPQGLCGRGPGVLKFPQQTK